MDNIICILHRKSFYSNISWLLTASINCIVIQTDFTKFVCTKQITHNVQNWKLVVCETSKIFLHIYILISYGDHKIRNGCRVNEPRGILSGINLLFLQQSILGLVQEKLLPSHVTYIRWQRDDDNFSQNRI